MEIVHSKAVDKGLAHVGLLTRDTLSSSRSLPRGTGYLRPGSQGCGGIKAVGGNITPVAHGIVAAKATALMKLGPARHALGP